MAVGYVYILSNSAMGKLLKIGFTCGSVERRARELSGATGVPGAFVVEYFHISEDIEEIETLVHAELNGLRYSGNREFFDASVSDAVAVIQRLINDGVTDIPHPSCPVSRIAAASFLRHWF
jgi:hypothetical protein